MLPHLKNSCFCLMKAWGFFVHVFSFGFFFLFYKLRFGSWSCKKLVWADLSIRTAPMKCEIQTVVCLITFHLNAVFWQEGLVVCINVEGCDHSFLHIGRADS